MRYSSFYDDLSKQKEDFSIIDIPGSTSYDYASKLMIYNQIHGRNNYAGLDFARVVEGRWDFQKNTPIIYDLLYSLPNGGKPPAKEIVNDYNYNLATKILNFYNIKYIIVSKAYLDVDKTFDGQAFENTLNFIDGHIKAKVVHEDKYLIAFKVNQSDHLNGWFLRMDTIDDFWGKKEGQVGSVARWARDGARLYLVYMGEETTNIRFFFKTKIKNLRKVQVYMNDELQDEFDIKEKKEEHNVLLNNVHPGENLIVFRIFDNEGNPVESYELNRGVKFSDLKTMSEDK
jgi:hypothetical protein